MIVLSVLPILSTAQLRAIPSSVGDYQLGAEDIHPIARAKVPSTQPETFFAFYCFLAPEDPDRPCTLVSEIPSEKAGNGRDAQVLAAFSVEEAENIAVAGRFTTMNAALDALYIPAFAANKPGDRSKRWAYNLVYRLPGSHSALSQTFTIYKSRFWKDKSGREHLSPGFADDPGIQFSYDHQQSNPDRGLFVFSADIIYNPDRAGKENYNLVLRKEIQWVPPYQWDVHYTFSSLEEDRRIPFNQKIDFMRDEDSGGPFSLNTSFGVVWGPGLGPYYQEESRFDVLYLNIYPHSIRSGFFWETDDEDFDDDVIPRLDGAYKNPRWMGVDNRYFLSAFGSLKTGRGAENPEEVALSFPFVIHHIEAEKSLERQGYPTGSRLASSFLLGMYEPFELDPGEDLTVRTRFFIGPKRRDLLEEASVDGDWELARVIDRSSWVGGAIMNFFAWLFEIAFRWIHGLTGSWGLSIILLTLALKLVLHPLMQKGMLSQEKAKVVQPRLAAIQKQYKGNPLEIQRRIRAVLKKEGVSILGGSCLTFLPQIPIFFGLMALFPYFVDIRSASFLWIDSLGNPDMLFAFPFWPHDFHVLPVLMAVVMAMQTAFMPMGSSMGGGDPRQAAMQKKVFIFLLPPLFLFLFWSFPSALVLFWAIHMVLQIAHQYLIRRMVIAKRALQSSTPGDSSSPDGPSPDDTPHRGKNGGRKRRDQDEQRSVPRTKTHDASKKRGRASKQKDFTSMKSGV